MADDRVARALAGYSPFGSLAPEVPQRDGLARMEFPAQAPSDAADPLVPIIRTFAEKRRMERRNGPLDMRTPRERWEDVIDQLNTPGMYPQKGKLDDWVAPLYRNKWPGLSAPYHQKVIPPDVLMELLNPNAGRFFDPGFIDDPSKGLGRYNNPGDGHDI